MTLAEALDRFLVQIQADGRSPHTLKQYRRHVGLLARWVAQDCPRGGRIEDLGHEALARFLAANLTRTRPDGRPKRATTMNTLRSSLRAFFAYLHRAGYIPLDPGRIIRMAICSAPPPRPLTGEERDRLLATLAAARGAEAERDHALFHLMVATGIRLSAAVGIDAEDLDLHAGEIAIHTKGNRTERVFLGKAIVSHLRRWTREKAAGPLFTGRGGRRLSTRHVHRRFGQWLKKAGIRRPASPHTIRHTFATDLYRRTGDILLVKQALHHRSIGSTMVYARATAEQVRAALA